MRHRHRTIALLGSALLFFASACSGSDDDSEENEAENLDGLAMCCELGAVCHITGDSENPEAGECHELAHRNVPEDCRAEYDRCIVACEGANDDPVEHACE